MRKIKIILVAALLISILILVPTLSRIGSWNELRRWDAPSNTFGLNKDIYLSVEEMSSLFDVFHLYPTNRILVSDGGYAFVFNFDIPQLQSKKWLDGCTVTWSGRGVSFGSNDDINLAITKQAVIRQIGK